MKKILLGVTRLRPKMGFGKSMEPFEGNAPLVKVKLTQRFQHPNVHRKRSRKSISKQQNAIGDLASNSRQPDELTSRDFRSQAAQLLQIELSRGNDRSC